MDQTTIERVATMLLNKRDKRPTLYQPIEHPHFADWAVVQPCEERLKLILDRLPASSTIVDVGCHTGWFCRHFARLRWSVTGLEMSPTWHRAAELLNGLVPHGTVPPRYRLADVTTLTEFPKAHVGLCLSTMMYLFKQDGWSVLDRMSQAFDRFFVDFGGQYADRLPFTEESFLEQAIANTGFTTGELIGRSDCESRPIFELS